MFSLSDLGIPQNGFPKNVYLNKDDIRLYCKSDGCKGERFFSYRGNSFDFEREKVIDLFLVYVCRNCGVTTKKFAVRFAAREGSAGEAIKIGEIPQFGPHLPSRVISLIGPDSELFVSGRQAENQGMGIGAFVYYRRVVERQQKRIIEEIGKVAARLGASTETRALFARAANETQFSAAIDLVKGAFPPALIMDGGHNPLSVLHSALSEGVHDLTDAQCLELATDIRLILTDLSERISTALKEDAELKTAVSRLLNRHSKPAANADKGKE